MSRTTYFNGLAAEEIAERVYRDLGFEVLEKRWRSEAGEVDLIVQKDALLVFIEVKARRSHETAAASISQKQWLRIMASAELFVSRNGFPPLTDLRFDAALIDQTGVCKIIENAPVF